MSFRALREGVGVFVSKARFAPTRCRWVALEPVPCADCSDSLWLGRFVVCPCMGLYTGLVKGRGDGQR
jgi:hypothetical protein